jgi:hypothetical protein
MALGVKPCANARRPIKVHPSDYVGWHNEAERRGKAGWTQEQCECCKRWTRWFTPAESRARAKPK